MRDWNGGFFKAEDFGTSIAGITDSVLREYAAQIATKVLREELKKAKRVYFDEDAESDGQVWCTKTCEHGDTHTALLICEEEIK